MNKKILAFTILFSLLSNLAFAQPKNLIKPTISDYDDGEFEIYSNSETKIYDPYEKFNRKIYAFNDSFDRNFFEYVARAYKSGIPKPLRNGIGNFVNNLNLPLSAINSFSQGKVNNGLATFSNFLINSTIGFGGFFNVASEKGISYKNEDFGQTIGYYGSGSGAYLVIPFLGPASTRDFSGWIVDKSVNPVGFNFLEIGGSQNFIDGNYRLGVSAVSAIDLRVNLLEIIDDVRKESFDPYATLRSAYLQKRIAEIQN